MNAVEHVSFHRGVVDHILEDQFVAHLQRTGKAPIAHEISTEAAVTSQAIDTIVDFVPDFRPVGERLCAANGRVVGHFKAIGHVTGERCVENRRFDPGVLHHVHDLCHQRPRLPSKGTARLHDDAQMRMACTEVVEQLHQQFHIIVSTRHQVAATEVDPFQTIEPSAETRLDVLQRVAESLAAALAMAMNVESVHPFR